MTDYKVSLVYDTIEDDVQIIVDNDEGKTEWVWKNEFTKAINMRMWFMLVRTIRWLHLDEKEIVVEE